LRAQRVSIADAENKRRWGTNESAQARVYFMAHLLRRTRREAAMKPSLTGNSPHKTDTVTRVAEILKDRPMPRPRMDLRRNIGPKPNETTVKTPSDG
jgi:hypothetical protein